MTLVIYLLLIVLLSCAPLHFAKSSFIAKSSALPSVKSKSKEVSIVMSSKEVKSAFVLPEYVKLIIGAGGIYAAFLYYGTLQEDVFDYKAADGTKFKAAWFLQALGTFAYFTLQVLLKYSHTFFGPFIFRGIRECYIWWFWAAIIRPNSESSTSSLLK